MRILFYARGEEHLGVELLSALLQREGHTTGLVFDPGFDDAFLVASRSGGRVVARLVEQALAFEPDLVALSTMTLSHHAVRAFAERLRQQRRIPTVAGGAHATACPERVLEHAGIDMVVEGEGERALVELVSRLGHESMYDTPGLCHAQGDRFVRNPPPPPVTDLDSLPVPDKRLFARKGAIRNRLTVIGSRGCRHGCSFCTHSYLRGLFRAAGGSGPYWRVKSPDNYLEEVATLQRQLGARSVRFWDEIFGYDPDWLEAFLDGYRRRVGLPFSCTMHATAISERSAALLAAAGCRNIAIGVESGSPVIRRRIHGRSTRDETLIEAARLVRAHGMNLLTENILCVPGETPDDMEATVALNQAMGPRDASAFIYFPFPRTTLFERCVREGLLDPAVADEIRDGSPRYNSWHKRTVLDHPHADHAWRLKLLLPLVATRPRHERLLRRLAREPGLERLLFGLSLAHTDRTELVQKLRDYGRVARKWRSSA